MFKIKFKKIKISSVVIAGLISISIPFAVLAYGTSTYQKPYPGSNIEQPYKNEVSTNVDTSRDYMYFTNKTKSIGFDFLYGSDKGLFEYLGEVSKEDHKEKKAKDYYYYPSDYVDGYYRSFAAEKGFNEDPSKVVDPRYKSLTVTHDAVNIMGMVTGLFTTLQKLFGWILKTWITIANFDISTILNSLNGASGFSKTLSALFLINPDNGSPSPLFVLSLGFFMFRLAGLSLSLLKGGAKGTAKNIFEEAGLMIAALTLASLFSVANGPSSLAATSTNLTNKIGAEIAAAGTPTSSIFRTDTGQTNTDIVTTQSSQVTQIWINQIIQAQFGVSVNELWIEDPNGSSSFGNKEDVKKAINIAFDGEDPGLKGFQISNGTDTINNLGYWLYAANSNTEISRYGKPFEANGKNTNLKENSSAARTLLVIDFLANLRKIKAEKKDSAMVAKIDNIMNYLTSPSYGTLLMSSILVMALYGVMTLSLLSVGLFSFSGKVICSIGVYVMAVMPLLMLIKRTRKTAKGLTVSYLMAFIRYLSGSALFNIILAINVLLASNGLGGIAVSMVVSYLLAKFGTKLVSKLNEQVTDLGRSMGEYNPINRFNGVQLQKAYQDFLPGGRRTKERNKRIKSILKNRDGENRGNKSFTDHVAQGFNSQQGFASGFVNSIIGKKIDRDFEDNLLYNENWDKDVKKTQEQEKEKRLKEAEETEKSMRKVTGARKVKLTSKPGMTMRAKNLKAARKNAARLVQIGGSAYIMQKSAELQTGINAAQGLSKTASRILNSKTPVNITSGAGGRTLKPKDVADGVKHAIENSSRSVKLKRVNPIDEKIPAENKKVLINPETTPEYGNELVEVKRKAPSGQRTGRRKPVVRQTTPIHQVQGPPPTNNIPESRQVPIRRKPVEQSQPQNVVKKNPVGKVAPKPKEPSKVNTPVNKPNNLGDIATPKEIAQDKNLSANKETVEKKPIVTDAMKAHGESIKTNIKMKAAAKIPIVGEMIAGNISKQHDQNVKIGKRISERAAEIAKDTAVKSAGRRVLSPEEAINLARQEIVEQTKIKPTSQHSEKEIKKITKANRKADKSIGKASKFVDRSEIMAKMNKK